MCVWVYINLTKKKSHIILAKTLDVWRLLHFSVFHLSCIFYQKLTVLLFSHQKMSLDIKSRSTLLNCLSQLWWVSCLLKMNTSCQPSTGWVVPDCGVVCVCARARVWSCHMCVDKDVSHACLQSKWCSWKYKTWTPCGTTVAFWPLRGGRQVSSSFIDKQSYKPYFLRRHTFTSIVIWVLLYRGKTVTSYSTVAAGNVSLIEASSSRCGRLSFFQLFFPRVCSLRRVCACGAVVICHTLIKGI